MTAETQVVLIPLQVGVVLEMPASLPAAEHVQRWFAEPVKALLLPTSVFVTNRKGFPTLPKSHQTLLLQFFGFGVQVVPFANNLMGVSAIAALRVHVSARLCACIGPSTFSLRAWASASLGLLDSAYSSTAGYGSDLTAPLRSEVAQVLHASPTSRCWESAAGHPHRGASQQLRAFQPWRARCMDSRLRRQWRQSAAAQAGLPCKAALGVPVLPVPAA